MELKALLGDHEIVTVPVVDYKSPLSPFAIFNLLDDFSFPIPGSIKYLIDIYLRCTMYMKLDTGAKLVPVGRWNKINRS